MENHLISTLLQHSYKRTSVVEFKIHKSNIIFFSFFIICIVKLFALHVIFLTYKREAIKYKKECSCSALIKEIKKIKTHQANRSVLINLLQQELNNSIAQRIIIKFLTNEGVIPSQIYSKLKSHFRDECLFQSRVYDWCKSFKECQVRIENKPLSRRPRT